jgi:hypothetical protein
MSQLFALQIADLKGKQFTTTDRLHRNQQMSENDVNGKPHEQISTTRFNWFVSWTDEQRCASHNDWQ